ncbi:MAG TPA: hypothetical protein VGO26_07430 [Amnibacterium sp.]|jgi:hypothetical protein|nr:hypothetical protein [Amnibacterium sp.]
MAARIEDHASISDRSTGRSSGSVDRLCFPRQDSRSMFGALLGGVVASP